MERNVKYMSIGIIFLAIVVGFCFFVLWMGRFDFNAGKYNTYYIITQDEASSVGINTPIKFKGITIGKVSDVGFDDLSLGTIKITLSLDSKLEVREGSYISIASSGLAGANYLAFYQGESLQPNVSKIIELKKGGLDVLLQRVETIGDKSIELMGGISEITNPQNIQNIQDTLLYFSEITQDMVRITKHLDSITQSVDANFKSGQYDVRAILNPSLLQLQDTLLQMDNFFSKATHLIDKIEKNPYDSLFGKRKNTDKGE